MQTLIRANEGLNNEGDDKICCGSRYEPRLLVIMVQCCRYPDSLQLNQESFGSKQSQTSRTRRRRAPHRARIPPHPRSPHLSLLLSRAVMSAFGFGSTQPQQQQQQQTTGFGAFGSTQNTTPATGGSLFGNTQPQQQQQGTNNGGGLFGASTSTQTGGTGGGLFGSTQPSGGSLYGNTNANQQQQQGGGLFGNAGQQTTGITAPSGGLFGATTTQPGE